MLYRRGDVNRIHRSELVFKDQRLCVFDDSVVAELLLLSSAA